MVLVSAQSHVLALYNTCFALLSRVQQHVYKAYDLVNEMTTADAGVRSIFHAGNISQMSDCDC